MNARLAPSYNAAEAWIYEAYEKDLWEGWSESFEAVRLYEEAQKSFPDTPAASLP